MNILEVKDLKLAFGKKSVLKDVTFALKEGEIAAYVGRNGSGKTTTIKTIIGQYFPDKGEITLFGEKNRLKQKKYFSEIGYVPETHDFYNNISVKDALSYVSGFYKNWDKKFEAELVSNFKLNKKSPFRSLSRGEKAKLFLTFALAHKPKLILMDEPTSHLDPVARTEFWESTLELIADNHSTVFVSTHLLSDIENIAEKYFILQNGIIEMESSAEKLKKEVKKAFIKFEIYDNLKNSIEGKIIFTKKHKEGMEIYVQSENLPKNIDWESISMEEILIAHLRNGE
ncbi:ABC transporter ATP-binding protein [bacterium]|nr:ABC transporter ATP-binding protein [bacterium]